DWPSVIGKRVPVRMIRQIVFKIPIIAALLTSLVPIPLTARAAQRTRSLRYSVEQSDLKVKLDKVVELYRKVIVLLDDETALSDEKKNRSVGAGRKIYYQKQQLIDALADSLTAEAHKAAASRFKEKSPNVDQFIDYVMKNPALRDADRLAY